MDLIATMQLLLRRWYVVVPTLLLSAVAVLLVYESVQPTYEARGTIILRSAKEAKDPKTGRHNQYTDYGNLIVPARVIIDSVAQKTYQQKLEREGMPGSYALSQDAGSIVPIVNVVGRAGTPADAIRTTKTVMTALDAELIRRQENLGAPRVTFLTTEVVAAPTEAVPLYGSRLRAAAGVLVLGIIVTLSVAFVTEAVARRRALRAATRQKDQLADQDGADAFECGLCGDVLPADEIIGHLSSAHSLGSNGSHTLESLFSNREIAELEDKEPELARRLRAADGR